MNLTPTATSGWFCFPHKKKKTWHTGPNSNSFSVDKGRLQQRRVLPGKEITRDLCLKVLEAGEKHRAIPLQDFLRQRQLKDDNDTASISITHHHLHAHVELETFTAWLKAQRSFNLVGLIMLSHFGHQRCVVRCQPVAQKKDNLIRVAKKILPDCKT